MSEEEKIAVVTGGGGHVGTAVVGAMTGEGWHVFVPRRPGGSRNGTEQAAEPGTQGLCTRVEADLTAEGDVMELMERAGRRTGRIDALINLVGMFHFGEDIHKLSLDKWKEVIDVNLTSVFLCCKHALPLMIGAGGGCIINTTSKAAIDIQAGASAYAVAKSGVITLTEALREELRDTGITANAIMPGIIDTAATRKIMPKGNPEQWVKPEQIAETVVTLCRGELEGINGSILKMFGSM